MTPPVTILLVDDHTLLRETLRSRIDAEPDLRVVGTAGDAGSALSLAADGKPDVILMDIDMPGPSCFDAVRELKRSLPETSVIFLSAFCHDRYIDEALRAQASGYLTKDEAPDTVLSAIRSTAAGAAYFSPRVQERIVIDREGAHFPEGRSRASCLTPREQEVLRLIALGRSKKEVAALMSISPKTVSRHVENLMAKLGIHDRVDLARFAIREGLAHA